MPSDQRQTLFYEAMARLTERYKGRYGLHTVSPDDGLLDKLRATYKRSWDKARSLMESALNWRISGDKYSTGKDLLRATERINQDPVEEILAAYMELARKDRLSHELIPAFLLEVAGAGRLPFTLNFNVNSKDSDPFELKAGGRSYLDLHQQLNSILSHMDTEQY